MGIGGDGAASSTVLAVSPHLDDAALSMGATLAELGAQSFDVHVLSLFHAVPQDDLSRPAVTFHRACGLPLDSSAGLVRRREDERALGELGATPHYAGLSDAIYRRRSDGSWLCSHDLGAFDPDLPDEVELVEEAGNAVRRLAEELDPCLVLTCAGLGGHVDHRRTRSAVTDGAEGLGLTVLLWEDLPYAADGSGGSIHGEALLHLPGASAWDAKWRAVSRYRSQVRALWPPGTDWRGLLGGHAARLGGPGPAELAWVSPATRRSSKGMRGPAR
jgi:LmbE family N-acetylglucosaminyl deacetylase